MSSSLVKIVLLTVVLMSNAFAGKHNLIATPGKFSTENEDEEFLIESKTSPVQMVLVELNLKSLAPGELIRISDLGGERNEVIYWVKNDGGNLMKSDQSYYIPYDEQKYVPMTEDIISFESTSGQVEIYFLSYGRNYGGFHGRYDMVTDAEMQSRCVVEDLPASNPTCTSEIAGYASHCTGNFICPRYFQPTGFAVCQDQQWRAVCLPDETGMEIWNDPEKCNINKENNKITNCPLDQKYLYALHDFEYDMKVVDTEAGRRISIQEMRDLCFDFCQKTKDSTCFNEFFPSDFNDKIATATFMACNKCSLQYKCSFETNTAIAIW